jgi:hypothetical protein
MSDVRAGDIGVGPSGTARVTAREAWLGWAKTYMEMSIECTHQGRCVLG